MKIEMTKATGGRLFYLLYLPAMLYKKYLPFLVLIAAALLLYYVKTKQRKQWIRPSDDTHITIPAAEEPAINRQADHIIYSKHAQCRMECRQIDTSEVKEILISGTLNKNKIQDDGRGITYPLEGITHDKQHVRIVFAPKGDNTVEVVTCIDLDTEWPCNCR